MAELLGVNNEVCEQKCFICAQKGRDEDGNVPMQGGIIGPINFRNGTLIKYCHIGCGVFNSKVDLFALEPPSENAEIFKDAIQELSTYSTACTPHYNPTNPERIGQLLQKELEKAYKVGRSSTAGKCCVCSAHGACLGCCELDCPKNFHLHCLLKERGAVICAPLALINKKLQRTCGAVCANHCQQIPEIVIDPDKLAIDASVQSEAFLEEVYHIDIYPALSARPTGEGQISKVAFSGTEMEVDMSEVVLPLNLPLTRPPEAASTNGSAEALPQPVETSDELATSGAENSSEDEGSSSSDSEKDSDTSSDDSSDDSSDEDYQDGGSAARRKKAIQPTEEHANNDSEDSEDEPLANRRNRLKEQKTLSSSEDSAVVQPGEGNDATDAPDVSDDEPLASKRKRLKKQASSADVVSRASSSAVQPGEGNDAMDALDVSDDEPLSNKRDRLKEQPSTADVVSGVASSAAQQSEGEAELGGSEDDEPLSNTHRRLQKQANSAGGVSDIASSAAQQSEGEAEFGDSEDDEPLSRKAHRLKRQISSTEEASPVASSAAQEPEARAELEGSEAPSGTRRGRKRQRSSNEGASASGGEDVPFRFDERQPMDPMGKKRKLTPADRLFRCPHNDQGWYMGSDYCENCYLWMFYNIPVPDSLQIEDVGYSRNVAQKTYNESKTEDGDSDAEDKEKRNKGKKRQRESSGGGCSKPSTDKKKKKKIKIELDEEVELAVSELYDNMDVEGEHVEKQVKKESASSEKLSEGKKEDQATNEDMESVSGGEGRDESMFDGDWSDVEYSGSRQSDENTRKMKSDHVKKPKKEHRTKSAEEKEQRKKDKKKHKEKRDKSDKSNSSKQKNSDKEEQSSAPKEKEKAVDKGESGSGRLMKLPIQGFGATAPMHIIPKKVRDPSKQMPMSSDAGKGGRDGGSAFGGSSAFKSSGSSMAKLPSKRPQLKRQDSNDSTGSTSGNRKSSKGASKQPSTKSKPSASTSKGKAPASKKDPFEPEPSSDMVALDGSIQTGRLMSKTGSAFGKTLHPRARPQNPQAQANGGGGVAAGTVQKGIDNAMNAMEAKKKPPPPKPKLPENWKQNLEGKALHEGLKRRGKGLSLRWEEDSQLRKVHKILHRLDDQEEQADEWRENGDEMRREMEKTRTDDEGEEEEGNTGVQADVGEEQRPAPDNARRFRSPSPPRGSRAAIVPPTDTQLPLTGADSSSAQLQLQLPPNAVRQPIPVQARPPPPGAIPWQAYRSGTVSTSFDGRSDQAPPERQISSAVRHAFSYPDVQGRANEPERVPLSNSVGSRSDGPDRQRPSPRPPGQVAPGRGYISGPGDRNGAFPSRPAAVPPQGSASAFSEQGALRRDSSARSVDRERQPSYQSLSRGDSAGRIGGSRISPRGAPGQGVPGREPDDRQRSFSNRPAAEPWGRPEREDSTRSLTRGDSSSSLLDRRGMGGREEAQVRRGPAKMYQDSHPVMVVAETLQAVVL